MSPKLLRCVAVVAVIMSLGGNLAAAVPTANAAPSLSASFTASWTSQPGAAHPDDTITYTATITNTGDQDATGVQLSDTPDTNTSLVPNSVHSTPVAHPDSYNAIGNVSITVGAPGLLGNDIDPDGDTVSVSSSSSTSAHGGTVSVGGDGAFTYNPPAGFNGTDSFNYTITDGSGNHDTATVSIAVSGMIWFIDNSQGSNGSGTLASPFNSVSAFTSVNDGASGHPAAGDSIFVYRQTASTYSGSITLLTGQKLIGQGAAQSLTSLTGLAPPSGSATLPSTGGTNPVITGVGTTLTLGTNNLVDGVTVSNSGGTALSGNGFGTLTVADTAVDNSAGRAISLNNGTLNASFAEVSAAGATNGISVSNTTGTFSVTGDGSTAGSGGTIQNISQDGASFSSATNVSLSYMTFTSANTTDGSTCAADPAVAAATNTGCNGAIYLANVSGVTLSHVAINTTEQNGVNGNNVTGFTMSNSSVQNAGNKSVATPVDTLESGLLFSNLLGTSSITNSTIQNNGATDLEVRNYSGTLNVLTLSGDTFGATGNGNQANDAGRGGIVFSGDQTAVMNVDLEGSTISSVDGSAFSSIGDGSAHIGVTVGKASGNTISTTTGLGTGITIATQDSGISRFDVENNTIKHTGASNIVINLSNGSNTPNTAIGGTIANNTLGVSGAAASATNAGGHGIALFPSTAGQFTVAVTNNNIFGVTGTGIMVQPTNGSEAANVTLTGNTVDVDRAGSTGVFVQNGVSTGGDTSTLCANVTGNNLHNSAGYNATHFAIQMQSNGTQMVSLPGYSGAATDTTAVRTFEAGQNLDGANPVATTLVRVQVGLSGAGYQGGSCQTPPSPPVTLRARATDLRGHSNPVRSAYVSRSASGKASRAAARRFLSADAQFASGNTFSIGTLPAGHSVTVTFQATVNSHINNPPGATSVTNQVSITDTNGDAVSKSATTPIAGFDTQTAITASPNPSVFGQSVTLNASVTTAASGTLTGTVQFYDGNTALGAPQGLSNTGTASLVTSALPATAHTLKAVYSGDDRFATSTGTVSDTVDKADTSTTVTSTTNPATFGQPVTFVATVSITAPGTDSVADPTGTVTFFDNNVQLGTGTLSTANGVTTASFTIQSLTVGSHTITATYGGDGNFNGSSATDGQGVSQAVQKADTTTTVASSAAHSKFGQSVTFTATVNPATSGSPTGTVTFYDGNTAIGSGTLSTNGGLTTAALTTSALEVGGHTITASYGGDTGYNGSTSSAITQTVDKADTTTSLNSSVNPTAFGQSTTLTATISISAPGTNAGGNPTGTVTFFDGNQAIGTGNVTTNGGVNTATLTVNSLSVGSHTLSASYGGDAGFNASSGSTNQAVNPAGTTTTVNSSANPSAFGQPVTFTATVSVTAPGTTAVASPSGTVTFSDGATSLGSFPVTTNNGVTTATVSTNALTVGSHSISAAYSGDGSFSASSGSTNQAVSQASTSTTVNSSANPSAFGQSVTFTATVSVTAPGTTAVASPGGTVTFSDGSNPVGTVAVSTANGVTTATLTTAVLSVGSHTISAAYGGDTNFSGSSGSTNQGVNKAGTITTLSSSVNPSLPGQSVTFTATVKVAAPGTTANATPTGTVTFSDNGNQIGTGTVSTSNGVTTATFTTSSLVTGSHPITATYTGDGNFSGSSDSLTQQVDKIPVNVSVASSLNPSILGQSVTFTATVTPGATTGAVPSGTITFSDGTTQLGTATLSGGQATFTTSSLVIGSHPITAQYSGDGTFKTGSGQVTQEVGYGVNLLYDPSQARQSGSTIPIKVDLFDTNGTNLNSSDVTLTLASPSVVPDPGAAQPTGTFSLNGGHYQYNLQTTGFAPGTYNLHFTAGNDPVVHSAPFTIK